MLSCSHQTLFFNYDLLISTGFNKQHMIIYRNKYIKTQQTRKRNKLKKLQNSNNINDEETNNKN